ncbi:Predicted ABC-type ATPase [Burkholderiales bacterium 8X]|nr:Predicted ABC-type ATPase [Burkholderiales bacterium 8X]
MGAARRPFIFVLAGVNGAGKSSVGGGLLREHGLDWFNPDSYARELAARLKLDIQSANAAAWQYGRDQLVDALRQARNFAFETTLGASTMPNLLIEAAATHDVILIYCGLASPELHLERVRFRVTHGGHDIPEAKIRERWTTSRLNLIRLLPALKRLQVFDNSAPADAEGNIPDPMLVLEMADGRTLFPDESDLDALASTPAWARPVVQAALQ